MSDDPKPRPPAALEAIITSNRWKLDLSFATHQDLQPLIGSVDTMAGCKGAFLTWYPIAMKLHLDPQVRIYVLGVFETGVARLTSEAMAFTKDRSFVRTLNSIHRLGRQPFRPPEPHLLLAVAKALISWEVDHILNLGIADGRRN